MPQPRHVSLEGPSTRLENHGLEPGIKLLQVPYSTMMAVETQANTAKGVAVLPCHLYKPSTNSAPDRAASGNGDGYNQCVICLGRFKEGDRLCRMPCLHTFHQACLLQWLSRHSACPLCNNEVQKLLQEEERLTQPPNSSAGAT